MSDDRDLKVTAMVKRAYGEVQSRDTRDEVASDFRIDDLTAEERKALAQRRRETRERLLAAG